MGEHGPIFFRLKKRELDHANGNFTIIDLGNVVVLAAEHWQRT